MTIHNYFSKMMEKESEFLESEGIRVIKEIGHGSYGRVYIVYWKNYKSYYALKKIPFPKYMTCEFTCLSYIDDPSVIRLYKKLIYQDHIYLLMEYCRTDLFSEMRSKKLTDREVKLLVRGIAMAIKACHDRNVAHSDIKPSNFLIDDYGRVKITDFGLCKMFTNKPRAKNLKGTLDFMSPEILSREEYNPIIADILALGVTIFMIATQISPFGGKDENEVMERIQNGKVNIQMIKDSQLRELVSRCLEVDVAKRATINDIVSMIYLNSDKRLFCRTATNFVVSKWNKFPLLIHNVERIHT